jgi:hypothetical protein
MDKFGHYAWSLSVDIYDKDADEGNKNVKWTEYHSSMMRVSARIAFLAGDTEREVVSAEVKQIWIQGE